MSYESLKTSRHVIVEAPTGLGKTSAVWAAVETYAVENRLRVLWLTRTASQVRQVAAETGATPVYGRRLLCLHEVVSKVDQRRFNHTCRAARRANCPYYPGKPVKHKAVTIGELKDMGRKMKTCPYELQLFNLSASTALVATHRQLDLIGWLLAKWRAVRERTVLIIDEGHHVLSDVLTARDSVSLKTLTRASTEAKRYGFEDLAKRLREATEYYSNLLDSDGEAEVEDKLPEYQDLLLAGEEVQERKLREHYAPASYLLSVADFKASLSASLAGGRPLLVREGKSLRLEAMADPLDIRKTYEGWARTVTVSATLSAELLEALLGEEVVLLRAGWPYGDNLRAVIVRGLTTRYEARDERLLEDIRWILELTGKHEGKTLVFLPSHDLLETSTNGLDVLREYRNLKQEDVDRLVEEFNSSSKPLVAVYNGRLSEGIDLSADLVLLVGIPFSPPTTKSSKLIKRLSEIVGENRAKLCGIILPGLWSALQAAGRAVRGPEDRATIYLIDNRYRRLLHLLPRWFRERVEPRPLRLEDLPMELGA